jgi:quinol-cytochrome oxidoreductase complex cytochrome b subunit
LSNAQQVEQPLEQRRKVFKQYKEDVRTRGKPFYPYAMLHDSIMSMFVVGVIIVLTVIWKYSTPGDHTGYAPHTATLSDPYGTTDNQGGQLGKLLDDPADPGTTSFVPRPDWYFYFLFYLLRIFKWPPTVIIGTVGIPNIALVLLLAMPFVDRRPERRPSRRPVAMTAGILAILSMAILTYKGATAKESLASELSVDVPIWAAKEGYTSNKTAVAGAILFTQSGCTQCHTYNGVGGHNLGAPDLTAEGAKSKATIPFEIAHLNCPSCVNPGSPMPSFKLLGQANIAKLAAFLNASKGDVSSSSGGG